MPPNQVLVHSCDKVASRQSRHRYDKVAHFSTRETIFDVVACDYIDKLTSIYIFYTVYDAMGTRPN